MQGKIGYSKQCENFEQLIIIQSPEDAFEHSENIIKKYIESIDYNKAGFEFIIEILKHLISYQKWELMDQALINIVDKRLENFTELRFNEVLTIIGEYIEKQNEVGKYSVKGIFYFINKVNSIRRTRYLEKVIEAKNNNIETLIKSMPNQQEKNRFIVEMLKTCFILSKDRLVLSWIEYIVNDISLNNIDINYDELIELIFIATYYEKDTLLANDLLSSVENSLELELPEIEI